MYQPERFSQLRWLQTFTGIAALLGATILIGAGIVGSNGSVNGWVIVAGGFGWLLAISWMTVSSLLLRIEGHMARQLGELRDVAHTLTRQGEFLESIAENTRISDAAKSLAHRNQEIEALRNAIREDIRLEHWEAALTLIDEMERRFGYKQEAGRIREELDEGRRATIEKKLAEAIALIESHFHAYDWPRAQHEIERLRHALPEDARVLALQDRLKALQAQHKQALKAQWEEAVRRNDTDHAIDVLKELDQYLSTAEAHSLQASARNVFKEKLLQLGVQFRFAVNEKRWHDALSTGLELVRDFPNARMANEVREVLDTLRERARAATETAATADRH